MSEMTVHTCEQPCAAWNDGDCPDGCTHPPCQACAAGQTDERAAYIAGLRVLADALEAHPGVPLPYDGRLGALTIHFLDGEARAAMAATAKALPCSWSKSGSEDYFDLQGKLAGVKVKLTAYRDTVCRRVVTGTHSVTEEVPDPDAPKVKVTKTVEDVTWECGSVLAAAAGLGKAGAK